MKSLNLILAFAFALVTFKPVFAEQSVSDHNDNRIDYRYVGQEAIELSRAASDLARAAQFSHIGNLSYAAQNLARAADRLYSASRGFCGRVNENEVHFAWESTCESYEDLRTEFDRSRNSCDFRIQSLIQTIDGCFDSLARVLGEGDIH